jgi:hypothetical protein
MKVDKEAPLHGLGSHTFFRKSDPDFLFSGPCIVYLLPCSSYYRKLELAAAEMPPAENISSFEGQNPTSYLWSVDALLLSRIVSEQFAIFNPLLTSVQVI